MAHIEQRTSIVGEIYRVAVPDEKQYVTDGNTTTTEAFLGVNDSIDNWHDTDEYPQPYEDELEDAKNALGILGVE